MSREIKLLEKIPSPLYEHEDQKALDLIAKLEKCLA